MDLKIIKWWWREEENAERDIAPYKINNNQKKLNDETTAPTLLYHLKILNEDNLSPLLQIRVKAKNWTGTRTRKSGRRKAKSA